MKTLIGLLLLTGLVTVSPVQAGQLYRFKVDGRVLIKDSIPPEYAHLGYEVLSEQGLVIKVVPRAPTAEEIAQRRAEEARLKARQEAIARQRESDQKLLNLYARPQDVERAQLRKAEEVESYVQLQRRRIGDLEQKLDLAQGQAAAFERRGQEVPADLRLEIVQLQNGIRNSEANIRTRQEKMDEETREFAEVFERIRILQVYSPGTLDSDVDLELVDRKLGEL